MKYWKLTLFFFGKCEPKEGDSRRESITNYQLLITNLKKSEDGI